MFVRIDGQEHFVWFEPTDAGLAMAARRELVGEVEIRPREGGGA